MTKRIPSRIVHGIAGAALLAGSIFALPAPADAAFGTRGAAPAAPTDAPRSIVQTIAGDGVLGIPGGKALASHFVMPVNVSVARDQSIIIVDAGADAIFRLRGGTVSRIAGSYEPVRDMEGATGGYRDGPANLAQFDRPEAAIELPDGSIAIADAGNHCIRLLKNGVVSTLAGSQKSGSTDGDRATATFNTPNSLAVDDGAILVGDYHVGIRKVTLDGTVSTLPFGTGTIVGLAATRIDGRQTVAYTEQDSLHLVTDGKDLRISFGQDRMPDHEGTPIFHAWGVAIVNENTVVVSDTLTGVVRLIRFPSLPFTSVPASLAISGTLHEDTDYHGGFRDGANTVALYHDPRGIALDARGRLVIADSSNRRIRLLSPIDGRETVLPDFSNYETPAGAYNVAIVGPSTLFDGVLYGDSIPGNAQAYFDSHAATDHIDKPVHVQEIRADAIGWETQFDIANEYLTDRGNLRAVVFVIYPNKDPSADQMAYQVKRLREASIATVVFIGINTEAFGVGARPGNECGCVPTRARIEQERAHVRELVDRYRKVGVQTESWLEPLSALESQPDPPPLENNGDYHYTATGQRFFGTELAKALLADRRWLK